MSKSVSTRVVHKYASLAKGQRRHDVRSEPVPNYVDQTRTHLNSIFLEPRAEKALRDICLDRRALRNPQRAMKKDAAIATLGIITFSHEAQPVINALSIAEQNALYKEAADRISAELNTTLTGLVVHRDESAPHAHYQMPAYNLEGIPLSKSINREVAKRLQDVVGEVYQSHEIHRGKPKFERILAGEDYSKTINRTVRQLHEDLPKELEAARKALDAALEKLRNNETLALKVQEELDAKKGDIDKLQLNIATYERRQAQAKEDADAMETKLSNVQAAVQALTNGAPVLPKLEYETVEVVTRREENLVGELIVITEKRKMLNLDDVNTYLQVSRAQQQYFKNEVASQIVDIVERNKIIDARVDAVAKKEAKLTDLASTLIELDESYSSEVNSWVQQVVLNPIESAQQVINAQTLIRYGVLVQMHKSRVHILPQEATDELKAVALYRIAREQADAEKWPEIVFTVNEAIAEKIYEMAIADNLVASVHVRSKDGQVRLYELPQICEEVLQSSGMTPS
ncbi:plasmid recombination protein [Sulfuriferula nivalis]|uniref:Plasmid recombination enzyme n=1 Tax=Sulfuriferula nivalis TaxID=2675298 RepID=A0A809RCZ4_9PROT|nr:plasmid recombination protein [Sulfuriferula nivalis]BBO99514.1 hypothetical protein SFSGTM_02230 [Sulfuriferula nivalis]